MTTPDKAAVYDLSWSRPNAMAVLAGCVLFAGLLLGEHYAKPHAIGERIPLWGSRIRAATELVNPNTASSGSLQRLPGIGPARAAAIIAHRQDHGPVAFHKPADLAAIKGIGPATVRNVESHLKFDRHIPTQIAPARSLNPPADGS